MNPTFPNANVSIMLMLTDALPYEAAAFQACLRAAADQDYARCEVLVADARQSADDFERLAADSAGAAPIRHVPCPGASRAALLNVAIAAATGDFVLLVLNDRAEVVLRHSAVQTMLMAATRHGRAALVYGDYELIDADGQSCERRLLDWHEGRLRDGMDFGAVWLCSAEALRAAGGLNERYRAADLYDLRLRLSEHAPPVHIANRYAGSLCAVRAPAKAHNVFDYLLADRDSQLEMEHALTEHLKRTGAYLAPGAHLHPVTYTADEQRRFEDCIASVVIPVNRRPEFIGRAIESVQQQTVQQVEVIVVVNGGPEDPTCDEVRRYGAGGDRYDASLPPARLIVVDMNNLGLCLNTGLAAARGKIYVQLDSDDRLKPDAVEKLLAVFDSDDRIGMVIGSYEVWNLDAASGEIRRNRDIPVVTHDEWTDDNGRNNLLRINGAGAPRSAHIKVIAEVGWFGVNDDPSCRNYGEDYDLVLRVSERYSIGRVWEPIYEVIRHAGGTDHAIDQATIDRNDNAKDHMRLAALRRRRRLNVEGRG